MQRVFLLVIVATAAMFSNSCKKELRMDMYIESVRVLVIPDKEWDPIILKDPDLRFDMSPASDTDFQYSTDVKQEVSSTPAILFFSSPVLVTDADWKIQLIDDDLEPIDTDDDVYTNITLNPKRSGKKGIIEVKVDGTVVMELNYSLQ